MPARKEIVDAHWAALVREIARLQSELRIPHLQAHVEMKQVLFLAQIQKYDSLKWY